MCAALPSQNFSLLQSKWRRLYDYASKAEYYLYSDTQVALFKLRCYAEGLVGELYQILMISDLPEDSFYNRLMHEPFKKAVPAPIISKLHAIRIYGNNAVHGNEADLEHAIQLLEEAYLIGKWFYNTLEESTTTYPDFVLPEFPKAKIIQKANTPEQEQAKRDLIALQKEEEQKLLARNPINQDSNKEFHNKVIEKGQAVADSFDLQSEKTTQLLNFEDAFTDYNLSDSQAKLVKSLDVFLQTKDHDIFLLKGYAGTGKTFITKGLTEYCKFIGRNYILSAPTGKASKVIAKKAGSSASTIHSLIYSLKDIKEYKVENLHGTETFKFYAELEVNTRSVDTIYIVDEASLVSDVYQESEFFRFGSGYLLRDFLKYVNLDHNDHNKKIIFIGDDAQLPPVGMPSSPALSATYLEKNYNVRVTEHFLTDVVRQKNDSAVLKNAEYLRSLLDKRSINQLNMVFGSQNVKQVNSSNIIEQYMNAYGNKASDKAVIIAYSNIEVQTYNNSIRERLFPGYPNEIRPWDKIMANRNTNAYGFFISNGDFGIVRKVAPCSETKKIPIKRKNQETGVVETHYITLTFRDVELGFKDDFGDSRFFTAKIIENLLYSHRPELDSDENKALYIDFAMRNHQLKPNTQAFKDALIHDPYFNAFRIKFGYAITCHKAQGSEWPHVFVKCSNNLKGLNKEYVRWLYTAITRTTDNVYLMDPPKFEVGGHMKLVASPPHTELASPIKQSFATESTDCKTGNVSDEQLPPVASINQIEEQNDFNLTEQDDILFLILKAVQNAIAGSNFRIVDINHCQYQEVYFFQYLDEKTKVSIAYNGKNQITSIRTSVVSQNSEELLRRLQSLKGSFLAIKSPDRCEDTWPEPFLYELYVRLSALTTPKKISILNVEHLAWSERYTFGRSHEQAVFTFWYNGKQQFTKCQQVQNSYQSPILASDIRILVTEELSDGNK